MRTTVKHIFLTGLILATGMYAATANASTLKAGAFYCDSKEDLQLALSLTVENDTQAIEEMIANGKAFVPTDEAQTVTITEAPSEHAYYGFRIRGSTTVYWTVRNCIVP